ncbi:DUF1294 domain-containing protein [Lignipirellula cremea]|uniref:DUF1294 domain-containing protein n=1 Tax=Lignipirellula cremea TaxID=2528010 RepID=A0A518E0N1_9BACT|nr:DUF1294 domain-containing protein [Lignipirellula cremea]QDU97629.1 hypothetical protein Pla8534_54790 [Lignipirellula cremea]
MYGWMLAGYVLVSAVMSVVTFAAYGLDKRWAQRQKRRIPEKRLHMFALLGGWPGAWAGQQYFRHKTQKGAFLLVFRLTVLLHLLLLGCLLYEASGLAAWLHPTGNG